MASERSTVQVKLFLTPETHQALKDNKRLTGKPMSTAVEELVQEVLVPEMEAEKNDT